MGADATAIAATLDPDLTPYTAIVALDFWALLTGMVTLATFGHTNNVISDPDEWITRRIDAFADHHGL